MKETLSDLLNFNLSKFQSSQKQITQKLRYQTTYKEGSVIPVGSQLASFMMIDMCGLDIESQRKSRHSCGSCQSVKKKGSYRNAIAYTHPLYYVMILTVQVLVF
jgi:hypothetical protein